MKKNNKKSVSSKSNYNTNNKMNRSTDSSKTSNLESSSELDCK